MPEVNCTAPSGLFGNEEPLRRCSKCREYKPYAEFATKICKGVRRWRFRTCRTCDGKRVNKWVKTPKGKLNARKKFLKQRYGITMEQYEQILDAQNGGCAICGRSPEEEQRRLSVDHDHKTKIVRGLLCNDCNIGIGMFFDNPVLLQKAAKYLIQNGGQN